MPAVLQRASLLIQLMTVAAIAPWSAATYAAESPAPSTPPAAEGASAPAETAPSAATPAPGAPEPAAHAPATTEPAAAAPEAAAAAPSPASPAASDAGANSVSPRKLVVLPIDFVAKQVSAGGVVEPVPAWTEKSQHNITQVIDSIIGGDAHFTRVPLPELEPAQQERLREHIELFKIVAVDVDTLLTSGGKAWADKKANFDYTLGDGLTFLRERSGADLALIVAGGQTTQSGGGVFMSLLIAGLTGAAVGGGGSYLLCGIVNLTDGRIEWFNSLLGAEIFGMKAIDMRNPDSAHKTLVGMFAPYPSSPLVGRKIF